MMRLFEHSGVLYRLISLHWRPALADPWSHCSGRLGTRAIAGLLCFWLLSPPAGTAAAPPTILVLGDSLSSAYGMDDRQGWVNLLRDKLDDKGYPHEVVNASVSGDTTRDALSRLDATLQRHQPDIVIVELGGNDGLRALSIDAIRANLSRILDIVRESGAKIILAGIRMPPNYGPIYTEAFERLYPELAEQFNAVLIPFFMEDVASEPRLMQDDGVHPNAEAQPVLLDNVWSVLEPVLKRPDAGNRHRDPTACARPVTGQRPDDPPRAAPEPGPGYAS